MPGGIGAGLFKYGWTFCGLETLNWSGKIIPYMMSC